MLDEILTIKRRREDDAAAAVGEAQRTLERREAERQDKSRELREYDAWQAAERVRLFEDVRNRGVARADLERYRERVGLLRQRLLHLEEELAAAQEEAAAAESGLQKAREARLAAHREVLKYEEYQGILERERVREAERREEAETEDVITGRH
ncbi:MAG: YscO family type III secretion system apparatus protein [Gammaproteobacteria bacterium]|nr:YscO family type III secretion system apparatus protein [Gammaproteobacteria bacterium]